MDEPLTVRICEPEQTLSARLRAWLGSAGFLTSEEVHESRTDRERSSDVVLLGLGPDPTADLHAIAAILAGTPHARVLVLHGPGQSRVVLEALRAGAWGGLCWDGLDAGQLAAAVTQAARGEALISPRIAGMMLDELQQGRPELGRPGDPRGGSKGIESPR